MVNIFSNPNTIDFQLQNNTVYDLAFDEFNNNILKSKSSINSLNDLKLSICHFKTLYMESSTIQNWFNDGWISYTPVIGSSPPNCSGGSGSSINMLEYDIINTNTTTITHNRGRFVGVFVVDSTGEEIRNFEVKNLSVNQVQVNFGINITGKVIIF